MEFSAMTERAADAEKLRAHVETLQAQLANVGRPTSLTEEKEASGRKAGPKRRMPDKKAGKKPAGRKA
jgi:hypothetical protein